MRSRFALIPTLFILLSVRSANARQEKILLREMNRVGDALLVEDQVHIKMKMKVSAPGQGEQEIDFLSDERTQYTERVLAVNATGRSSAVRRTYKVARTEESNPDGKQTKTKSLEGKTVEIRVSAGKVIITSSPGKLDTKDEEDLRKRFKEDRPSVFPDHPVAIGESWTVDAKGAKAMFSGAEDIDMKMKLLAIEPYQGHRCAKIEVTVGLTGKMSDSPLKGTMKLAGYGYHALDANIPLLITANGPFQMSGDFTQGGTTIKLTGQGEFEGKFTNQVLERGAK